MRFILTGPIHLSANASIPQGAEGIISQYDEYHLQLTFDVFHKCLSYWDNVLVLDIHDTDEEVWNAIEPVYLALVFDQRSIKCEKATRGTIFADCT